MHQGVDKNNPEEDLTKIFIFPHSAVVSAEAMVPKKIYKSILKASVYCMYVDLYSTEKDKNYVLNFNMFDLTQQNKDVTKFVYFKDLGTDYQVFIKSFMLVFQPFKKHILNFERDKQISLREYLDQIKLWMPKGGDLMLDIK